MAIHVFLVFDIYEYEHLTFSFKHKLPRNFLFLCSQQHSIETFLAHITILRTEILTRMHCSVDASKRAKRKFYSAFY